ncbi:hypothetical protein BDN71DRAFT_1426626 [Pleurotus eryngii]|uniref:Uncharacterized protein n=1 Tax=Pleurotus eryngii TaxID=5323 RepID=A0A9P6A7S2_PLEER|nr:hypothetical protein BDN71DRAFT_1426626 [Pleurotus eryngii]
MARTSNKPPDALPRTPSKKKTPSKTKDATQNAQLMTLAQDTPGPSTNSLLAQTILTTDQWYRSRSTKNGYANYVKAGKKWLAEWVEHSDAQAQAWLKALGLGLACRVSGLLLLQAKPAC